MQDWGAWEKDANISERFKEFWKKSTFCSRKLTQSQSQLPLKANTFFFTQSQMLWEKETRIHYVFRNDFLSFQREFNRTIKCSHLVLCWGGNLTSINFLITQTKTRVGTGFWQDLFVAFTCKLTLDRRMHTVHTTTHHKIRVVNYKYVI